LDINIQIYFERKNKNIYTILLINKNKIYELLFETSHIFTRICKRIHYVYERYSRSHFISRFIPTQATAGG
jgi:hypothetical protein